MTDPSGSFTKRERVYRRRSLWAGRRYLKVKRLFDLAFCALILVPVALVGLLCAIAIRLDSSGPVLFTQVRVGRDGRPFRMYKFRTMVENAEELKASLAHLNVLPPPDFKIPNDPRITGVGKFLRRTSLDELPQFINVMTGEMSIVGPRPTDFGLSSYDLWHCERLEVPPGITGLWQLEGRASTSFDERLRLDIEYLQTMSLVQDIKLIVRTVAVVFRATGV
jgi:lipopolysaccharide/colanic/teichoic acid biosynthesis glycosyltransferase